MAISASNGHYIYAPAYPSSYGYDHHVEFTESSTSTENNASTLNFTAYLRSTGASFSSTDTSDHNNWLSIYWFDDNGSSAGTRVTIAEKILSLGQNAKFEITGTLTVPHKADGTLSGYALSYWTKGDSNSYTPASGEIATATTTLTSIARASKPTVSASSLTIGNSLTISTNRASSSFTHTIKITANGHSVTYTNVGASKTFTATEAEWMPYMASKSYTAIVSCQTYSGTTKIGSAQTCSFTLNVDASKYKPVIGSVTHTDTNTTTSALESDGSYILGYSAIEVTIPVSVNNSSYSSKLKTVTVTHNGRTQTYSTTATSYSATYTATVTAGTIVIKATDSRGVSVSKTITLTTIAYAKPKLTAIDIIRINADKEESETGNYIKTSITANVFLGNFGKEYNTLAVATRRKLRSASSYSSWVTEGTITTTGSARYKTGHIIEMELSQTYSASSQYDLQVRVTDKLGNSTIYARVHEGIPVFAWGSDHFDVYGEFHTHDRENPSTYATYGIDSKDTRTNVSFAAFGFITASGQNAYIFIPLTKMPVAPNITSLTVAMRIAGGGYLVGADANLTSEISNITVLKQQGMLQIVCTRSGGYGVTNNTPMAGKVTLTYSY